MTYFNLEHTTLEFTTIFDIFMLIIDDIKGLVYEYGKLHYVLQPPKLIKKNTQNYYAFYINYVFAFFLLNHI